MSETSFRQIAIIGFGEVGGIFGKDLAVNGFNVSVFDCLLRVEHSRPAMLEKAGAAGVRAAESVEDAVLGAELVISVVTASSAVEVAQEAAPSLRRGQFYLDANSVSPDTQRNIAGKLVRSEADFVEAAVMAPVAPQRLKVPILLGGARAETLAQRLHSLGMDTSAVSERIGVASAIKMCRSVVMKGLAALAIEALFAARRYGAEDAVIASFEATYPNMGWAKNLPDSLTRRAVEHTRRRASEMREVAETLEDAGINPFMALATAELQDWLTQLLETGRISYKANEPFSWRAIADAIANGSDQDGERVNGSEGNGARSV
jgi:3-hydroxyisobutyrate dehydrogenase-like beta-hydroxyacid dehydrogenase